MFKKFKSALVGILTLSLLASSVAFAAPTEGADATEEAVSVNSISVNQATVSVEEGKTVKVGYTVSTNCLVSENCVTISVNSTDKTVATAAVSGNEVEITGVKEGSADVTVTATAGESTAEATIKVTVTKAEQEPPKQDPPKQDPPKQDPPKQDPPKQDPPKSEPKPQKNAKAEDGSKVDTKANGTAVLKAVNAKKKAKTVKVSNKVEVGGVKYDVTEVGANAFKSVKGTVQKITLPATVKKIDNNAFKGLKKLKTITLKSTKSVTIQKSAFKGVNTKKVTIVVSKQLKKNKAQFRKFKKALDKAGFKGKVK